MDVLGDGDGVRLDQIDLRIVVGDRFADEFALLVVERGLGAEQARAFVGAAEVGRMARRAVGFIERLAARETSCGASGRVNCVNPPRRPPPPAPRPPP